MKYNTVKIITEATYRSTSMVNITDDMIKVTISCSVNEWHTLKRHINNIEHSECKGDCNNCQNSSL